MFVGQRYVSGRSRIFQKRRVKNISGKGYRAWRNKICSKAANIPDENQAFGIAFGVDLHPFAVKNTTMAKKVILDIKSHPVKVTKNVIEEEITCRFNLGGALGGQLPKECRERKCAKSFVSFTSRSPEVGMMCELLPMLISGAMVLSPDMFCGRKAKRRRFVRGGVRVKFRLASRRWGRGRVSCTRARLSRWSV